MRYQSTTGLAADQIEELVVRVWQIVQCREEQLWPPVVGLYRAVVLTLVYVRQNLNQAAVGDLFGLSQPTVSRVYRGILPLIGEALCLHVPDLEEAIRGRLVLVDGTDVPTGNRAGHEDNYSGKRRRAGLNIQVAADTDGGLLAVSIPLPGSMHDRKAFTECGWEDLLAETPTIADPAYQGTHATTPRKKPKNGELSTRDKESNNTISSIRSAVERCIAHLKNWKILATGYRGRLAELPNIIRIVTSLEFYRRGW
ncbi:transposase family protein [Saccharopolyspora sp. ASAGF58]|uniref:transposase family protein n=1 Tax=Saccharopolyspora sp. ASAGF58 TaxID=2719023 RepID=UPI00143FFB4D|nr:transposase family protein [Saccharopolyspora sp. ASAGF58]QIZ37908.1 transposase [Saccharopolyspora sp. ASAGF58]QIZ37931.1 transposase [Saccharopolyspora sp. ASAGF58]